MSFTIVVIHLHQLWLRLHQLWLRHRPSPERGDVPGWVLITIMTAGLVTALWAIAGPKLGDLLTAALDGVTGP
ncbi:MAG TPA: hypothetical protein VGS60_05385 [Actinomycetes bacterium]|nr:hypothetical protein [Actinomycetes bacterium]